MTPSNNSLSFLSFVGTTDLCTHLHKVSLSIMGCVLLQGVSLFSLYFLCEFGNFSFSFSSYITRRKNTHIDFNHISKVVLQSCLRLDYFNFFGKINLLGWDGGRQRDACLRLCNHFWRDIRFGDFFCRNLIST